MWFCWKRWNICLSNSYKNNLHNNDHDCADDDAYGSDIIFLIGQPTQTFQSYVQLVTSKEALSRGLFRTLWNIFDRVFLQNTFRHRWMSSQPEIAGSKLTIEALEQGVKYLQS